MFESEMQPMPEQNGSQYDTCLFVGDRVIPLEVPATAEQVMTQVEELLAENEQVELHCATGTERDVLSMSELHQLLIKALSMPVSFSCEGVRETPAGVKNHKIIFTISKTM